jgi:hypothetical protein
MGKVCFDLGHIFIISSNKHLFQLSGQEQLHLKHMEWTAKKKKKERAVL